MPADTEKIRPLIRIGKLLGRAELEKLFKDSYQATKDGKTLVNGVVNGKNVGLQILSGMSPSDVFVLAEQALTLFDALTARGTLDAYIGTPVNDTAQAVIGRGCVGQFGFPYGGC